MSQHIPPALLQKFVLGNLEEPVAVAVATHLDQCVRCSAAAAASDPLSAEFASVDDPPVPATLTERIHQASLEEQANPSSPPRTKSNVALYVLAASLLVAVLLSPDGVISGTQSALSDAFSASNSPGKSPLFIGAIAGFLAGGWVVFRLFKRSK